MNGESYYCEIYCPQTACQSCLLSHSASIAALAFLPIVAIVFAGLGFGAARLWQNDKKKKKKLKGANGGHDLQNIGIKKDQGENGNQGDDTPGGTPGGNVGGKAEEDTGVNPAGNRSANRQVPSWATPSVIQQENAVREQRGMSRVRGT